MKEAIEKIHHAIQFIAFFSNAFLKHESDDSQANCSWNPVEDRFMSRSVDVDGSPYISIGVAELKLYFHLSDVEVHEVDLSVFKAKKELYAEINKGLKQLHLNHELFRQELQYELPDYIDLDSMDFNIDEKDGSHFGYLQTKAYEVIGIFQKQYKEASALRIWPHHFDHSILIELVKEDDELQKSMSFGLGIPDNHVDEPYFYVTHWKKEGEVDQTKARDLPYGTWHTDKWLAAVLPHSELHRHDKKEHVQILYDFFQSAGLQSREIVGA